MPPLVIPAIAFPNGLLWTLRNTVNIHPIDHRLVVYKRTPALHSALYSSCMCAEQHMVLMFWLIEPISVYAMCR